MLEVATSALPRAGGVIKVTTRWIMTIQTDGTYEHSDVATVVNEIVVQHVHVGINENRIRNKW